jgi:hypothetical protein
MSRKPRKKVKKQKQLIILSHNIFVAGMSRQSAEETLARHINIYKDMDNGTDYTIKHIFNPITDSGSPNPCPSVEVIYPVSMELDEDSFKRKFKLFKSGLTE